MTPLPPGWRKFFLVFLWASCFWSSPPLPASERLREVTLCLKFHDQFQFAGYYAAQAQGFYAEEGLAVRLLSHAEAPSSIDAVLEGRADFGVSDMEILQARGQGRPVVLLAPIFQHSPLVVLSLAERGLRRPEDLVGRRLMSNRDDLVVRALFTRAGIDPSSVEFVPYTDPLPALLEGRIDASIGYLSNEPNQLRRQGVEPHIMYPSDYGIDFYGDSLFTSQDFLRRHPEVVERFLRASLRGWDYALQHPDEIIDLILQTPGLDKRKTREHLRYEAEKIARLIDGDLVPLGHLNPRRLDQIAQALRKLQVVPEGFSTEGMIYMPAPAISPYQRWLPWIGWGLAGLTALGFLTVWWHHRLRRAVQRQTAALLQAREEVEAAQRAKTEFLATMNHELRTPLNGILGPVSLLQEEDLTPAQQQLLSLLHSNTEHLLGLIEKLLEVTCAEPPAEKNQVRISIGS